MGGFGSIKELTPYNCWHILHVTNARTSTISEHTSPMAEGPSTKRAKRSHIVAKTDRRSASASSRSSPLSQTSGGAPPGQLPSQPDYGFSYDFVDHHSSPEPSTGPKHTNSPEDIGKHDPKEAQEDQSYEFRLFSTTTPTHITLARSPSPSTLNTSGSILRPRPDAYYLTFSLPASVHSSTSIPVRRCCHRRYTSRSCSE